MKLLAVIFFCMYSSLAAHAELTLKEIGYLAANAFPVGTPANLRRWGSNTVQMPECVGFHYSYISC